MGLSSRIYKWLRPQQRPVRIAIYYVIFAAVWIYLSSYVIGLESDDPEFLRSVELIKGLLFVVLTGSILYLLLSHWRTDTTTSFDAESAENIRHYKTQTRRLVIVFTIFLVMVPLLSFLVVLMEKPKLERQTFSDLKTISTLKAKQIETWLQERYSDGYTLTHDASFTRQVYRMVRDNRVSENDLLDRLQAFRNAYGYRTVALIDAGGNVLLQAGEAHSVFHDGDNKSYISASEPRREHSPIFRDEKGKLHFDLILPLSDDSEHFIGSLLLDIDPNGFLFPYLQQWPADSRSGETLLVQQRGDSVQFLNQPRFGGNRSMDLYRPFNDRDLPAALALHDQQPGIYTGKDYRDVDVFAASHPVAGTSWQVLAKQDRREVLEPLYTLVRWIALVSLFAVSVIAVSLLIIWRQQQRTYQFAIDAEKNRADRLLRHFYDLPFIGMAITSPTTKKWLQFNDYFCEMLGYSKDELASMGWDEVTHPDDLERNLIEFESARRGEIDGYTLDKRFIRKNGSIIYTTIDVRAVRKANGQLVYFVSTIKDISQRYLSEQQVRNKELQLRTLVKTLPDLVWLKDADGVYLLCNPVFERFFGVSEAEIVGKTDYDFVSQEQADFFRSHDQRAMASGSASINEEWLTFRTDGYHGLFETIKTPMFDNEGELIGILGTARDITDRKMSEQKIQQLNRIYATLSSTNEAIVRSKSEAELLPEICRNAVEYGGFRMAWIGFIDPQEHTIKPFASFGHDTAYLNDLNLTISDESVYGSGPTGIALREGQPYWSQDFLHENIDWPWRERAAQAGFAAAAALPLFRKGRVTGGFVLYSDKPNTFDEASQGLLSEMASDISFALDNFDREQYRQAIEERLALVIQGSHDAPWDWNLETNDFFYSPQWWQMLGYEPGELLADADTWRRLAHPDDLELAEQVIARVMNSDRDRDSVECRFQHKDGHYVPTLVRGAVSRDSSGRAVRLTGTIMDLTERKAIEAELKRAAEVFEQNHEGIFITDTQNRITMVNKAFTTITGYSKEEVLGRSSHVFSPGRLDEQFYADMQAELDREGYWHGEIWNRRKDGTDYPEWLSLTRTFDDRGNFNGHIGIFEDITQRKKYEEHIHWLAHFDHLTNLPNRTLLIDRSEHVIKLARRNNTRVALLYCDLDRFKNINDTLGHSVGDKLLAEVAKRLTSRLRDEDTVSRQGGDEFIIVLPDIDTTGAANVAQDLIRTINQPYRIDNYDLTISVSIGITIYPDDGQHFESLSKSADIAMYRAKHLGGNNYCFFTPDLESMTARMLKLESDMQTALDSGQFEIYYQPQISLSDGGICGVEALLRWQHPEFGMVSPAEFIPVAENSGQILRVGEWVARSAMLQLQQWVEEGIAPIKMAINLSVKQLRQVDLIDRLSRQLSESGVDPRLVELEITESMLMEDQGNIIKTLNRISEMGFKIAIDDFGTGYSSLAYLKRLPVDYLKIDKTFTQDMLDDPNDAIIARSIIALGHSLGLLVIAEGVETEAQFEFLRAHQCDQMQGYLFSKPLPADEIQRLLTEPKGNSIPIGSANDAADASSTTDDRHGKKRRSK